MPPLIVFLDRDTLPARIALPAPCHPHRWQEYPSTLAGEIVDRLQGATVAIVNKVRLDAATLAQLPTLRLIAIAATGSDNVDLAACRRLGISVCNIQRYAEHAVAEHTMMLMLALSRRLLAYHQAVQAGDWQRSPHFCLFGPALHDLAGKRLGLIGSGSLGQAVARLGEALGMQVVFAARRGETAPSLDAVAGRWPRRPFDEVLSSSDVLSLHCPLNAQTRGLIGASELAAMPTGALLINTARGGIVDDQALLQALQQQHLGGAASDVASQEPPQADDPLLAALSGENFILTPHVAWASDEAMQTLASQLSANIDAFFAGERLRRLD